MGFSCPKNLSMLFINSLWLFLLINTYTSVQASDSNLVKEICPKTRNPAFCFQILGHLQSANLHDLCKASIEPTQQLTFLASDEARVLLIQGRTPALNDTFRSCIGFFQHVSLGLSGVEQLLNSGKYQSMPAEASSTLAEAGACDRHFQPPASEPAELKKASMALEDGCSVLLVISKLLARHAI